MNSKQKKKKLLNTNEEKETNVKDDSQIKENSKLNKKQDKNPVKNKSEDKNKEIIRSEQYSSSNKIIKSNVDNENKSLSNKDNDNTKEDENKDDDLNNKNSTIKRRKQFLGFGLTILILIVIIIFAVSQINNEESQEEETFVPESYFYSGFLFQKGSGAWYSSMILGNNTYNVSFVYGPKEVDYIDVEHGVNDVILHSEEILVTTDPNYSSRVGQAQVEIVKITSPRTSNFGMLNIPTFATVTYIPESAIGYSESFPTATCDNATANRTVINLVLGNDTRVYTEDFCIIVEGETESKIVEASDRLLYGLLGIIK